MHSKRIFWRWITLLFAAIHVQSVNDTYSSVERVGKYTSTNKATPSMNSRPTMTTNIAKSDVKDCVLLVNESEVTDIIQLTKSDLVNIVDLRYSFATDSNNQQFADMQVTLVTDIGRQILYTLDIQRYYLTTWTLNVGRENFNLHVEESPKECIGNKYDFIVANTLKQIVLKIKKATYEICYNDISWKVDRICCHITKRNVTDLKYKCVKRESFIRTSNFPTIFTVVMMGLFPICCLSLLYGFLSHRVFEKKYPDYYKLLESTMSPSSMLFKIIWKEYGCIISFYRKLAILFILAYAIFLSYYYELLDVLLPIAAFFLTITSVAAATQTKKEKDGRDEFVGRISLLNQLSLSINTLRKNPKLNAKDVENFIFTIPTGETQPKCTKYACYLVKFVLFPFVFLFLVLFLAFVTYLYVVIYKTADFLLLIMEFEYSSQRDKFTDPDFCTAVVFRVFCPTIFLTFMSYFYLLLVFTAQSLLFGFLLNLVYFLPYFASFSIFTFYCCTYWKSMEEKYYLLKLLIYEACQHKNVSDNSKTKLQENEKLLSVVSKELYENIRGKLLPYDTNLFWLGVKILCLFVLSFGIFELIDALQKFNISATVQGVTTLSVGILPYILNVVALKSGGKEKGEARKKELESNVQLMIGETRSELAQTFLVVQGSSDTIGGNIF